MNVLVVSHPRSGIHFLMNIIAFNFLGYDNERYLVPFVTDIEDLRRFFLSISSNKIFKSHHNFRVLDPIMDIILKRFKVFYIVRDGRDVMTSLWFYFNKKDRARFPHAASIGELMKMNPRNWYMGGNYNYKTAKTFVHRWVEHVELWYDFYLKNNEKIELVKYENLIPKMSFYSQINCISNFLGQSPRNDLIKPTLKDKGVFNRKGVVGDYKNYFTKEDCEFFDSIAKPTMIKLGYD